MRIINWLHISDIHLRPRDRWSQDVVLTAMCEDIARRRGAGNPPDFVLLTGDIAFSGSPPEYDQAMEFLVALSNASGVPAERVFCIPGNHDIARDRQILSFRGGRATLVNQNQVDPLLAPRDDLQALLERQQAYRAFQQSYGSGQDRRTTRDTLAYVVPVVIDEITLAIVGLDSAWLAEGGIEDHGNLLIGERQVINALDLAKSLCPHVTICMTHHPLHLLREFDRRPVQNRIERECDFLHCGHLHEPEARAVVSGGTSCLTLTAGASFETRTTRNAYSLVSLDLFAASRSITTLQYDPSSGGFAFETTQRFAMELKPSGSCSVDEFAAALRISHPDLTSLAYYLAALLLDKKSEVPIPTESGYTFGAIAVLEAQPDSALQAATLAFVTFKNILRLLCGRLPLEIILQRYGDRVWEYGAQLEQLRSTHRELDSRLARLDEDAQVMADHNPGSAFAHTTAFLNDLAKGQEWEVLRAQSERHVAATDDSLRLLGTRMLALALAHSAEEADRRAAVTTYRSLANGGNLTIGEIAVLASLLVTQHHYDEARGLILSAIASSGGESTAALLEVGARIVEATGDRAFRVSLSAATRGDAS